MSDIKERTVTALRDCAAYYDANPIPVGRGSRPACRGKSISMSLYEQWRDGLSPALRPAAPAPKSIRKAFGSWNDAMTKAGLPANPPPRSDYARTAPTPAAPEPELQPAPLPAHLNPRVVMDALTNPRTPSSDLERLIGCPHVTFQPVLLTHPELTWQQATRALDLKPQELPIPAEEEGSELTKWVTNVVSDFFEGYFPVDKLYLNFGQRSLPQTTLLWRGIRDAQQIRPDNPLCTAMLREVTKDIATKHQLPLHLKLEVLHHIASQASAYSRSWHLNESLTRFINTLEVLPPWAWDGFMDNGAVGDLKAAVAAATPPARFPQLLQQGRCIDLAHAYYIAPGFREWLETHPKAQTRARTVTLNSKQEDLSLPIRYPDPGLNHYLTHPDDTLRAAAVRSPRATQSQIAHAAQDPSIKVRGAAASVTRDPQTLAVLANDPNAKVQATAARALMRSFRA